MLETIDSETEKKNQESSPTFKRTICKRVRIQKVYFISQRHT